MRTLFNSVLYSLLLIAVPILASGQFDDLYFNPSKDKLPAFAQRNQQVSQPVSQQIAYIDEYEDVVISDDYYDDYDYSYTTRIRRFHSPARVINHYSFNTWYDDFYYDPFFPNNNINVFVGSPFVNPWGWNSWNVGWRWSSWRSGWGWNSWNNWGPGWGWNNWNVGWGWNSWGWNSWGWNSWNRPWGWNNCPSIWYVNNNFYGNNWNGWNNWNNNNWNNSVGNNTVYGSRRGGSTSSSTRGISASPRREITGGTSGQVDRVPDTPTNDNTRVNSAASRGGADRSRVYRGDIRNPDAYELRDNTSGNTNASPNTTNATRSSIYRRPDNQRADSGRTIDRTDGSNDNTNASRNSSRGSNNNTEANRSNSSRQSSGTNSYQNNTRPAQDNIRQSTSPRSSGGGFDSGSSSPRSSGNSGMNSGSSRSSGNSSMNSSGGSSRSSSGGGSRRGG